MRSVVAPVAAVAMAVILVSLIGLPPLAGFFGKFLVFTYALKINGVAGPAGWLALLAIAMSAVSLYYYLLILKQALVVRPAERHARIVVPLAPAAALGLAASLLVALGIFPSVVLRMIN